MIKPILFLLLVCCLGSSSLAQTNVELNIQHKFEKSSFVKGQTYMDDNNRAIRIDRIQYYISAIELTHDGGMLSSIPTQHYLAGTETITYDLGTIASNVIELESIKFNLGVDAAYNNTTPSSYSFGHPLADASMYSTTQNSYIFLVIEGMIDTDGDQIPDEPFEMRATGDQLLHQVDIDATAITNEGVLKINLVANIAHWLRNIDLEFVGIQENSSIDNANMLENTTDFIVFQQIATTSVNTLVSPKNHIFIDSRLSVAPTIHYKFYTSEQLDMTITSVNGAYFIQRFDLNPDGDFFMSDHLASGIYIVIFTTPKGIRQSKRFVIRN